mgnify:CR=1 FL=1
MENNIQRITQALEALISRPEHDEHAIKSFFAAHYRQTVNGIELDYDNFIAHMARLKQIVESMALTILAIAQQGNHVLTHHRVEISKRDGEHAITEVFARFTLENKRIVSCYELTRLISGNEEDKRLGSTY